MPIPRSRCWPDDPDYLDGATKIDLPSEKLLRAYWDVDIVDPEEEPSHNIIDAGDSFTVRFRLELQGDLWTCISGDWCFDLVFTPIGKGTGFDLSDLLGRDRLCRRGWRGCDGTCIYLAVEVPANTIPVDYLGTLYEVGGKFQLSCCGKAAPVVGYEALEEYQFFKTALEDE